MGERAGLGVGEEGGAWVTGGGGMSSPLSSFSSSFSFISGKWLTRE